VTRIYKDTPSDIQRVAEILAGGGIVAVPTETVYGLAVDAFNTSACQSLFRLKGRPLSDPLIVHLADGASIGRVAVPNVVAEALAEVFWPGPLTLVLAKNTALPEIVTAGLPSVAVRVPGHPALHKVLTQSGLALAAPSANPFGYVSPTRVEHILKTFASQVTDILDGGPCAIGIESTVLDIRDPSRPQILRPGAVTREQIEESLGGPVRPPPGHPERERAETRGMLSPGMLDRHYSPKTPIVVIEKLSPERIREARAGRPGRWAAILFRKDEVLAEKLRKLGHGEVFWFTESGEVCEAAHGFFDILQTLDSKAFDTLYVEPAGPEGLGAAINDRLARAAAGRGGRGGVRGKSEGRK